MSTPGDCNLLLVASLNEQLSFIGENTRTVLTGMLIGTYVHVRFA